jgi:hypothetical protein
LGQSSLSSSAKLVAASAPALLLASGGQSKKGKCPSTGKP